MAEIDNIVMAEICWVVHMSSDIWGLLADLGPG